eukprot:gb/GEZN01017235.1/.p2 GENE.gb/GEZN01017235.1/~~gb/GEZN01017235.1/.p2  ORF type:complete len:127 (+),score=8.59 gb/GEZN01017235.1/:325-705(+)
MTYGEHTYYKSQHTRPKLKHRYETHTKPSQTKKPKQTDINSTPTHARSRERTKRAKSQRNNYPNQQLDTQNHPATQTIAPERNTNAVPQIQHQAHKPQNTKTYNLPRHTTQHHSHNNPSSQALTKH